jgi:hypothetical protein
VEKIVDYFRQSCEKTPVFPLVNPGWNLISKANPYLSTEILETPCSPGGFTYEQ